MVSARAFPSLLSAVSTVLLCACGGEVSVERPTAIHIRLNDEPKTIASHQAVVGPHDSGVRISLRAFAAAQCGASTDVPEEYIVTIDVPDISVLARGIEVDVSSAALDVTLAMRLPGCGAWLSGEPTVVETDAVIGTVFFDDLSPTSATGSINVDGAMLLTCSGWGGTGVLSQGWDFFRAPEESNGC